MAVGRRPPVLAELASGDVSSQCFALIIDAKSPFTCDYSRRVADLRARAALLHDLGKLIVPNRVLDEPGALDAEEWALIRQHPAYTLSILERVRAILARESGSHFDNSCVEVCDPDLLAHATTAPAPVQNVA